MDKLQKIIEKAWDNKNLLDEKKTQNTINEIVGLLDNGKLRVAEPLPNSWKVNEWVKKL